MKFFSLAVYSLFLAATLSIATTLTAQEALNDGSITKMAQAGLSDDTIVALIATQAGQYNISPDALVAMKKAGVSERILGAVVAKASGAPVASGARETSAASGAESQGGTDDLDIGVYQKVNGAWSSLPSERVNWKTGGVLKSIATDGIVKGDINGRLRGADSPDAMHTPLQFLIKAADGMEATDFQLVHLHEKKDAREFRTVTGGVFHASGGASRDQVSFDQKSLGHHAYFITFAEAPAAGEYAFLVPGFAASTTSGSTGKAYTFHLVE